MTMLTQQKNEFLDKHPYFAEYVFDPTIKHYRLILTVFFFLSALFLLFDITPLAILKWVLMKAGMTMENLIKFLFFASLIAFSPFITAWYLSQTMSSKIGLGCMVIITLCAFVLIDPPITNTHSDNTPVTINDDDELPDNSNEPTKEKTDEPENESPITEPTQMAYKQSVGIRYQYVPKGNLLSIK